MPIRIMLYFALCHYYRQREYSINRKVKVHTSIVINCVRHFLRTSIRQQNIIRSYRIFPISCLILTKIIWSMGIINILGIFIINRAIRSFRCSIGYYTQRSTNNQKCETNLNVSCLTKYLLFHWIWILKIVVQIYLGWNTKHIQYEYSNGNLDLNIFPYSAMWRYIVMFSRNQQLCMTRSEEFDFWNFMLWVGTDLILES